MRMWLKPESCYVLAFTVKWPSGQDLTSIDGKYGFWIYLTLLPIARPKPHGTAEASTSPICGLTFFLALVKNNQLILSHKMHSKAHKHQEIQEKPSECSLYVYANVHYTYMQDQRKPERKETDTFSHLISTYHTDISKPANCLDPTRSKVVPSSKVLPIASNHHWPFALPSSPTYSQY